MTEPDPPYTRREVALPAVYTRSEAADLLGVSEFTIGQMVRDGRLRNLPGFGRTRILRRSLLEVQQRIRVAHDGRDGRQAAAAAEMAECGMLPHYHGPKACVGCGLPLTGLRRRWCGADCSDRWWVNHAWSYARPHAIKIAGGDDARCARCGVRVGYGAEVNHIVPRDGRGYGRGCHHHQANLEVLCHDCHSIETTKQRRERRVRAAST